MNISEIKQALQEKYKDIWDIIYDSQRSKLVSMEKTIEEFSDDSELVEVLTTGFAAQVEMSAREYKANIGNRFYFHKKRDFLDDTLKKSYLFDSEGNYLGAKENTIHSFIAFQTYTIDLCFGDPSQNEDALVSEIYIPMRRKDYSDWKILNLLQHIKKTKGFSRETMKMLVDSGIAVRRKF